jgi:hypothetical protein
MHSNPWNQPAFETQIVAIILAPTLICISVYLTLKHICLTLNPSLSRVSPRLLPWIFVPADVSCLAVQAVGGGVADSAKGVDPVKLQHGNRTIIAGIVLQVVVLAAFGFLSGDYLWRVRRWLKTGGEDTERALVVWKNKRFRLFVCGITIAYVCILIRCIYR